MTKMTLSTVWAQGQMPRQGISSLDLQLDENAFTLIGRAYAQVFSSVLVPDFQGQTNSIDAEQRPRQDYSCNTQFYKAVSKSP